MSNDLEVGTTFIFFLPNLEIDDPAFGFAIPLSVCKG
jgi:hypothetical protein